MDRNVAGSCSCCTSSCERSGVWRKPVTSRFDFALDLSLDPAADRGCGDPISAKTKTTTGNNNASGRAGETKEEMMEVDEQANNHKHHTAKINLLEPDGVEARVCSRHVEQAVRERLYLFGEDCNYSIWWFPRPDYASTVWRTDEGEEGAGLVVGDPDIVSLAKQKEQSSKKNKKSPELMYQNLRPTPPIKRREADSSSSTAKDEDDGIGEELKNLILNDNTSEPGPENSFSRNRSLSPSTAGATSPAQINRDLFMAKRTGILGTKKPVVKSSAMTRNALSFDLEPSTTSKQAAQPKYLAPASNHRIRWLKRRELGGPGCGTAVRNYHRYEIAKNYSTSSPYSTNALLATTPSGRVGQGLPVNLPQTNTTPGGGAGGFSCGGAVRVWSDLKNISHLYHVVPLDQSEAEITLEELSHPDVFSDSRIGCSIQLIHSTANRNDTDTEDEIIDGADEDLGEQEETEPMETESLDTPEQRRHLRRSTNDMFAAVPSPQIAPRHSRIEQLRHSGPLRRSTDNTNTSIVPSTQSTGSAPSTPTMARLRPAIREEVPRQREEEDEELVAAALEAQRQEEANNRRQGSAIRMHRRRSIVSAADSIIAPQVKVVSTTTPLAYKRRGGEELLQQLFEAGVHCRSRHKYVSFVDVPMPSISPTIGWPGLEEFLGRFRQMCTMSGVAIVNESRDRRRRVFVGSEHSNTTSHTNNSSELRQSSSNVSSRDIKGKQSDENNHLVVGTSHHHRRSSLRISSSSLASSAVIQSTDSSSAGTNNATGSTSLDWQLIRERAAMIVDFRKPLTNYGSFWNEHYFRRRLSMPIHGTVLTARSDPVFACKNPDVIAHYLGEANTAGRVAPDLCDGRQPTGGSCKPLPPPLVPSDPTIVHQSYTLTFYPDLDGGFSASLEYLTLHSPNCSVSALDHIRRRFIVKHANKFQQKYFNASADERQAMEATYASVQRVPIGRVNELPANMATTRQTFNGQQANWNGSIWRSIEDVVAGLKVPESSKSTHTYQQDNLERVLDFLKERTCNTLAQEELQHKQRQQKKMNDTEMTSDSLFRFVAEDDEDQDEYQLLRLFGLLEDVEKNVQKCLLNNERFDASQIEYDFGAPVRWTFLPSLQFYQTRITV